jgi:hypothetical protein
MTFSNFDRAKKCGAYDSTPSETRVKLMYIEELY